MLKKRGKNVLKSHCYILFSAIVNYFWLILLANAKGSCRKRDSSQTMTYLVGVKFCYHCFSLANASLICELEYKEYMIVYII